jgi:PAS domain S-box-containing protein
MQYFPHQSEICWRYTFEWAPLGMAIADLEGWLLQVNPALCQWLEYSAVELQGMRCDDITHPGDRPDNAALIQQLLRGDCDQRTLEKRYLTRSGKIVYGILKISLVRDEANQPAYFIAQITDITDQQETAAELQRSHQYYQSLLESIDGIIWEADAKTLQFTFVSPQAEKIMGFPPETWIADPHFWFNHVHPDDRQKVLCYCQEAVRDQRDHTFEYRMIAADGRIVWLYDVTTVVVTENRPPRLRGLLLDITTSKQAEAALDQSQRFIQQLTDAIPNQLYVYNLERQCEVYANRSAQEFFGRNAQQLWEMGDRFLAQCMHPDDWRAFRNRNSYKALADGELLQTEYRMKNAAGEWRWLHSYEMVFSRTPAGKPEKILGTAIDITDRKQAEAALQQREAEFRALVENSPDLIMRFDRHCRCLYANPRVEQELGITPAVLANHALGDLPLHKDLKLFWQTSVQRVLATGREQWREFSFQMPACPELDCPELDCGDRNQVKFWSVRLVPELNDQGTVQSVLVVSRNITEQKQAEAALRASEEKFSKVFRASPDPISITSLDDYRFVDVNDSFLEITQYRRDEVIGRHYSELNFHLPPEIVQQIRDQLRSEGMISTVEIPYLTRGGETKTCLVSGELIQLNGQTCLLTISKDITDRKRAEQVLHQQIKRQRVITEVTQRIRQSLNFEEILSTTVQEVRQLLKADRVLISQILPDGSEHILVEAVKADCLSLMGKILPPDRVLLAQQTQFKAADGGQVGTEASVITAISQPDLRAATLDDHLRIALNRIGVKSRLLVPINAEQGFWGLLVAHQCDSPRTWENFEIDVLEELAAQVAIAIQQSSLFHQVRQLNANLEQEVRERTRQLRQAYEFESTLKSITDKVRDSLDEDQIMQVAVRALGQAIRAQGCNAAIYDLEQGTSQIKYEYTTLDAPFQGYTMQMANFQQGYDQLLNGQYFQCCGLVAYPQRDRVAMLACPMQDNQGVLGDLWVINHPSYGFTEQDIRLTQQVANQCAIAIRQARLYQTAQRQVAELERLNQLKDDFLSTVSHELRTPMANIKMATQMLEMLLFKPVPVNGQGIEAGPSPMDGALDRSARYFQILKDEGQREISLINDLLDLSRLDSGADPLILSSVLPNIWLHRVVEPFRERAATHQQALQLVIPDNLPELVTDLSSLERAVTELLNNACKYTPAGERICLRAESDQYCFQIWVSNTGVTIPAEERDRIFDKFYRIPNNDPWKHGGTGLGLALVRKLIERLGGVLELQSQPQVVTFHITLPLQPDREPVPPPKS